jgi:hypothetical protein
VADDMKLESRAPAVQIMLECIMQYMTNAIRDQ